MVRGKLTRLNDQPILNAVPEQSRGHNTLHRELNLSWMWEYPADNRIVSGKHWTTADSGKAIASVEDSMAQHLHLKLGDTLSFQIGDQQINASIVNFRSVDWGSFHPNFYVIFPPGLIDKLPATHITSFNLPADKTALLNNLIESFPNVTVVDTANILKQLQVIVEKVTTAIQYLFLFSLGSGMLIVIISIQTSMDERRQTWRLIRILGASRRYIITSILVEFGYLFMLIITSSLLLSKCFVFFLERNFMH